MDYCSRIVYIQLGNLEEYNSIHTYIHMHKGHTKNKLHSKHLLQGCLFEHAQGYNVTRTHTKKKLIHQFFKFQINL